MLELEDDGFEGRAVAYANAMRLLPVGLSVRVDPVPVRKEAQPVHFTVYCQ